MEKNNYINYNIIISLIIILLPFISFLILEHNSFLTIGDRLDESHVLLKL